MNSLKHLGLPIVAAGLKEGDEVLQDKRDGHLRTVYLRENRVAGFQLVGDMTLHGVTRETTWNVVATFGNDQVSGRATTTLLFTTFGIAKPSLARLLTVDDEIELEVEFRAKRSAL